MKLSIGCRFDYDCEDTTPAVFIVEPHTTIADTLLEDAWDGEIVERYVDLYGNACCRAVLPAGPSSVAYNGMVNVDPGPESIPPDDLPQSRIEDLPAPLLHWLLPSRFCESDTLADRAWEMFGAIPPSAARVYAICNWIHASIEYGVASIATTTAAATLDLGGGMCRDMAHVGVTFCRAVGIPARYVFGYMPDLGIPGPYPQMDFHAWFEVWLGGQWWTFDARFNVPRIGRVPIGHGRDAADVAMVTTYGVATLERMTVWAEEPRQDYAAAGSQLRSGDGQ